jgi:hypothetical protein
MGERRRWKESSSSSSGCKCTLLRPLDLFLLECATAMGTATGATKAADDEESDEDACAWP